MSDFTTIARLVTNYGVTFPSKADEYLFVAELNDLLTTTAKAVEQSRSFDWNLADLTKRVSDNRQVDAIFNATSEHGRSAFGVKIEAIKFVKNEYRTSLKAAKDAVEAVWTFKPETDDSYEYWSKKYVV